MAILNLLVNLTKFSQLYSYEIAYGAIFFTSETPIYVQNEHKVLFLLFSPNVLLVPKNGLKNLKVDFYRIFVKSYHPSNFYEANFFLQKLKEFSNQILNNFRLMLLFEDCTLNGQKMKKGYF